MSKLRYKWLMLHEGVKSFIVEMLLVFIGLVLIVLASWAVWV